MRLVHVVPGLGAARGGPSYSVPRLCKALGIAGVKTTLLSVADAEAEARFASDGVYRDVRFAWDLAKVPVLQDLRMSTGMARALRASAAGADVIHSHGLWSMPNLQAGWEAARRRQPLVVSPRGMLSAAALSFSALKKKVCWRLAQGGILKRTNCIHATSIAEYDEIRAMELGSPVAIISNGIDMPELTASDLNGARTVLSLGRIHPKKGLDRLVKAWAGVEADHPEWRLRIVGPAESRHDEELRRLATSLSLQRVSIEGPLFDEAKLNTYRQADVFALPTLNENFAMTVAEALAAETPVISTKGAPWAGLEREGCGWWIDHGVEPLVGALKVAMCTPRVELDRMGARGRAWMRRDFSWDRVASEMCNVYEWLIGAQEKPDCVRLS